jgi:hypothetical protein
VPLLSPLRRNAVHHCSAALRHVSRIHGTGTGVVLLCKDLVLVRHDLLLVRQNLVEFALVFFDVSLIFQDCLLVILDHRLILKNLILVGNNLIFGHYYTSFVHVFLRPLLSLRLTYFAISGFVSKPLTPAQRLGLAAAESWSVAQAVSTPLQRLVSLLLPNCNIRIC